jgi:hypothetical protein
MPGKQSSDCGGGTAIKRFLRHKASGEYFKEGGWTANPADASKFNDALEAAEACARYGLNDVELAIRYESAPADVFCTSIR